MTTPLTKRARQVLYAVVTEFIATGEPVGSRTLTKKYGFDLSPATIRNVLADLEDAGYLAQPHTSAGRVPTEAAFRLFIDALMRVRQLSDEELGKIREWFEDLPPGVDILRETGKLLSDLTNAPAVLVRSGMEKRTLIKLRFIPIRPNELLSVLVLSDGSVENRFVTVERNFTESELERIHNMLEEAIEGRTLAALRDFFKQSIDERRDELAHLRQLGLSLMNAAIERGERAHEVVIEGHSRLFDRPEFSSGEPMKELLRALEDRERLMLLLDRTLSSSRVQVFLAKETSEAVGVPLSVVAAPYHTEGGQPGGAVGIIGPTRMDYPTVVPLVAATADAMSVALRSREGVTRVRTSSEDPSDGDE